MRILIAGVGLDGSIGIDNRLPWGKIPADMKHFAETTSGHVVIMGRKTYESIPASYRPLKNRENVIVTRDPGYTQAGCEIIHSFDEKALKLLEEKYANKNLFIIGGGELYAQSINLHLIDAAIITRIGYRVDASILNGSEVTYFDTHKLRQCLPLQEVTKLCDTPLCCHIETYAQIR